MGELFHTLSRLHIFPEAVLRTCPGYRPVDDSEPVAGNLAGLQMQKSLLVEQAFQIWSVIEDSNLRPLRPERSALPGCANHRMRGASYC